MALVKRSEKVAFYGVTVGEVTTYHRMTNFTDMSISKNPKEYARQYIDEDNERTDVVGYSPEIGYSFDLDSGNAVHTDIVSITDGELVGDDATRTIVIVDTTATGVNAVSRLFAVIPDSEGDSTDAYTYSGTFKAKGTKSAVTATISTDGLTCTVA